MSTIVTRPIYPPIPSRDCDWCAHYDEYTGDVQEFGYGPTEEAAIADLRESYPLGDAK